MSQTFECRVYSGPQTKMLLVRVCRIFKGYDQTNIETYCNNEEKADDHIDNEMMESK